MSSTVRSFGVKLVAIGGAVALFVAMIASVGVLAIGATPAVAGAATVGSVKTTSSNPKPQLTAYPTDCSFNGATSTSGPPPKLAAISVSTGTKVSVSCKNLSIPSGTDALAAGQGSPLALIANCGGASCTSSFSDEEALAENESDLDSAVDEVCLFGCGSTWSTTYTVPSPFKSGGSADGGLASGPGDPNAVCPPSQEEVNMGLIACAATVAQVSSGDANPDLYGVAFLKYSNNPTPANPTLALSSSSAAAGSVISLSDKPCTAPSSLTATSGACPYWWGNPLGPVPSAAGNLDGVSVSASTLSIEICPTSGGSCTAVPDPASSPSVKISPPAYDFNTSTDKGTLTAAPKLSGSITIPSTLAAGSYNVEVYETNSLAIDPGNSTNSSFPNEITASAPLTVTTAAPVKGATYTSLSSPARVCDTRSAAEIGGKGDVVSGVTGQCANSGTPLSHTTPLTVKVSGLGGVPTSNVSAVVLNVTAASPDANGYLTVYPGGGSIPSTSSLNFVTGAAVPNLVTVGLGSSGTIGVATNVSSVQVAVDVEGYFTTSSTSGAGLYNPLTPARLMDTRCSASPQPSFCASENLPSANSSAKPLGPGGIEPVTVTGVGKVPSSGVSAVVLNVTVAGGTHGSYLTAYAAGSTRPTASNLNWQAGKSVPNRVVVTVGTGGKVDLYNYLGTVNVIVDVNGYFTSAGGTGAEFFPLSSPVRMVDTRCSVSPLPPYCSLENLPATNKTMPALGAGKTSSATVAGLDGVPSDAVAAMANVTVTSTTTGGYLTVWPGGSRPTVSDLDWAPHETVANAVVMTLSSSGTVTVYNYQGSSDVIVDVSGWFAPAS